MKEDIKRVFFFVFRAARKKRKKKNMKNLIYKFFGIVKMRRKMKENEM